MITATRATVDWVIGSEYRASVRDLAIARMVLAGYLLLALPQGRWIATLPQVFYNPPLSIAALFDDFASPAVLTAVNLGATAAVLCLFIGYRTRWASVLITLLLVVLQSLVFATGKIDHNILVLLAPAIMASSGWGDTWSADAAIGRVRHLEPGAHQARWQLSWMAVIIAIAMATAGLVKIYSGWLALDVSSSYGHAMANAIVTGRHTVLGDFMLRMPPRLVWEPLDWTTVIVETAGLLAWWRARWFRAWLVALVVFHLGVALHMDIWFSSNLAAYALFAPWARVVVPLARQVASARRVAVGLLGGAALLLLVRAGLEWLAATATPAVLAAEWLRHAMILAALPLAAWMWLVDRRQRAPTVAVGHVLDDGGSPTDRSAASASR